MKNIRHILLFSLILTLSLCFVNNIVYADVSLDAGNTFCVRQSANFNSSYGDVGSVEVLAEILGDLISDQSNIGLSYYNSSGSELIFMPNYHFSIRYYSESVGYGIWVSNKDYSGWVHSGSKANGFYLIHCHVSDYAPDILSSINMQLGEIYYRMWATYDGVEMGVAGLLRSLNEKVENIRGRLVRVVNGDIWTIADIAYNTYARLGTTNSKLDTINSGLDRIAGRLIANYQDTQFTVAEALRNIYTRLGRTVGSDFWTISDIGYNIYTRLSTTNTNLDTINSGLDRIAGRLIANYQDTQFTVAESLRNIYSRTARAVNGDTWTISDIGYNIYTRLSTTNTKLDNLIAKPAGSISVDLTNVEHKLDTIDNSINNISLDIEIPADSELREILVLSPGTDTEEEETITGFSADLFKSGGKLLGVLYRVVFKDALGGIDSSLDGFEDFYIGGSAPEGGVDVWD